MGEETLVLVHAVFRHGERTPDIAFLYPKDPYLNETFSPYGEGQLMNEGKKTMYNLGTYLRKKYASYLGCSYHPEILEAVSSEFDRAKTSLQLVCASLFEPQGEQIWHDNCPWQPIPFKHVSMLTTVVYSKEFIEAYNKNFKINGQDILEKNKDVLAYLKEHTGLECNTTRDVWIFIAASLSTEVCYGLKLPEWANAVYPEKIIELVNIEYGMQTATKRLRQLGIGELLHKVVRDTERKIDGESKVKLHLYSGHDCNISNIMETLMLPYKSFPANGSCIIFEVHLINGIYWVKIFHKASKFEEAELMTMPNCDEFCTFTKFSETIKNAC